jgi:hypothetical protein
MGPNWKREQAKLSSAISTLPFGTHASYAYHAHDMVRGWKNNEDALMATVTRKSYVVYDNIDGANLDDPKKAGLKHSLTRALQHLQKTGQVTDETDEGQQWYFIHEEPGVLMPDFVIERTTTRHPALQ